MLYRMAIDADDKLMLKVLETLNEAQTRWCVAREAIRMGRGGLKRMHQISGLSSPTIMKGMRELRQKKQLNITERIRCPGGGRKRLEQSDPQFGHALNKLMEESVVGDPMSHLRWTNKSTTSIAEELTRQGHPSSDETVRRRLRELGYAMQANVKVKEGPSAAGRDEQFRCINVQVKKFLARGKPVLSVDTKKKEQVGEFKNPGATWRPKGTPLAVNTSDYPDLGRGPAIPYGACDVNRNEGFVNVGMTHDTAEFAVESLRRWWRMVGRRHCNAARALLLCADGGGSKGGGIMAGAHKNSSSICRNVINSIGGGFSGSPRWKIAIKNLAFFGSPGRARIFEIADVFLLFGVDTDDGQPQPLEVVSLGGNDPELVIALTAFGRLLVA